MISTATLRASILFLAVWCTSAANADQLFVPADRSSELQAKHDKVPQNDIWWTVPGEQMRWMHLNAHQLFPTVNVYRQGEVRELEYAPSEEIANAPVDTPDGTLPFREFLESKHSTAMGVVIVHHGKIAFEHYPRMQQYQKPIYWSVAKVMPATVLRIMEERGEVDVSKPIEHYIKDLSGSAFAGISVRNILDMATGLDCQDEYDDRQSCYYQYSMAIGDGFREDNAPDNPYDFLKTLEVTKHADQGTRFSYSGVNTFLLGWLVEELTGYPFHDVFTKEVWSHVGAEADASFIAYRYGIPLAHGGFLSNMRDLARFGLLFTPSWYEVSDRRIVSERHVEFLKNDGNPALLTNAGAGGDGVSHNIYQWDRVYTNGDIYKGGWGGQGLVVNPDRDFVAVFTSYFKDDYSEVLLEPVIMSVLDEVYGE